jgi:hypothetical protein
MAEQAKVAKGQVWRRKKTGALLRVTRVENVGTDWLPYYDVRWETVEKPIRRGASYEDYWVKNCELTEDVSD